MSAEILTPRLKLRRWRDSDRAAFASMNADARVMEFFPKVLSENESDELLERIRAHFSQHGYGLWAVEIPGVADFGGFIGLQIPKFDAHFTPCVEIGWRLKADLWGHGYATEGASAVLDHAFTQLNLAEVVSMTATVNKRSRRVMERIGMTSNPEDAFDHPSLRSGHWLERHVLYKIQHRSVPLA